MSYGDVYIHEVSGYGVDVTIELANGKFAKMYTGNQDEEAKFVNDALRPSMATGTIAHVWRRKP